MNGAGGLRTKPEVLAWPVKDYKALVVAHDLFMAGWHTVVQDSWSLYSSKVLLHKQEMVMENKQLNEKIRILFPSINKLKGLNQLKNPKMLPLCEVKWCFSFSTQLPLRQGER